jgi:GTPase
VLHDRVTIEVEAGAGGNGCVSFRREAHVPRGGPDGGDGGRGGDIVIVAHRDLRDLSSFRHRRHYRAGRGAHGRGAQRHGAAGETLEIRVACGTVVENLSSMAHHDLTAHGDYVTVARGGAGGTGNRRFATSTRQAPRFAEQGLPGETATLELRLKLLADVGIVGAPNAGKSSLLRRLTKARPKVADYPFTTIQPALGTIDDDDGRQLVLADIPGLIEGASAGAGLGHEFLAHVERTRLLVHLVDIAPLDQLSPQQTYANVRLELERYGAGLESRPFLLVLSKIDLLPDAGIAEPIASWQELLADDPHVCRRDEAPEVLGVSSATGAGLDQLRSAIFTHGAPLAAEATALPSGGGVRSAEGRREQPAEHAVIRPTEQTGYEVKRRGDHSFEISGPSVERLIARHDLDNQEALAYIEERLRVMGVIKELEAQGFEPGEEITIGEVAFNLYPGKTWE